MSGVLSNLNVARNLREFSLRWAHYLRLARRLPTCIRSPSPSLYILVPQTFGEVDTGLAKGHAGPANVYTELAASLQQENEVRR